MFLPFLTAGVGLWCASFFLCDLVDIVVLGVSNPGVTLCMDSGLEVGGVTPGVAMGGVAGLLIGADAMLEGGIVGSPFLSMSLR